MRKRNKTSRGARAFAARNGRGNSRAGSGSGNSKNDSTSQSSSLSSNRGSSTRGRRGKSDNYDQISSHTNGFTLRLPEQYYRNRNGVSSMSSTVLAARASTNSISSDYYLHKKFKKLTTTTLSGDESKTTSDNNGAAPAASVTSAPQATICTSGSDMGEKDATTKNINNNNISVNNHKLFSEEAGSITRETGEKLRVNRAVTGSPASRNLSSGISIISSQSTPISGSCSSTSEVVGVSSSNFSVGSETPAVPSSSSIPSSSCSSSSVVYKPKFRIAAETVEDVGSCSSEASNSAQSIGGGEQGLKVELKPGPGKLNGEKRMDRQSLDDRISKIIDENQSILSTWPEHLTKKLKSHVQRHQQQLQQQQQQQIHQISHLAQRNNTMVIMSGGSATESPLPLTTFNSPPQPPGIKLRPIELTTVPVSPPLLLRSHSDAGGIYASAGVTATTAELSPVLPLKTSGVVITEVYSQPDPPSLLSRSSSNNTGSNGNSTVVPKKRRRLSPTPNRLCGGEVAELPMHETGTSGSGSKSYYQDVDMTVRVSNCGTSGAKVTIRTNGGSSNSSVINYNRLIDVPSSPLKISESSCSSTNSSIMSDQPNLFIRTNNPSVPIHFDKGLPEKDSLVTLPAPSPPSDLKVGKPRGRPPKKGRMEPVQISSHLLASTSPGPDPSSKLRALVSPTLTFTITNTTYTTTTTTATASNGGCSRTPLPSTVLSPLPKPLSLSPPFPNLIKVEDVKTESKESDKDTFATPKVTGVTGNTSPKPLLLQSSTPNPKRPTFLALRPVNAFPKKSEPGVLPSPETPRGARAYSQMYINGHAYTYLGFKVSTRSSYTCLFKPQPMFLPQETDPKLSMYSNWQPRSRNKSQDDVGIPLNDSRVNGRRSPRSFLYTSAKRDCGTETVNSPDTHKSLWSILDGSEASPKSVPSPISSTGPTSLPANSFPVESSEAIDLQVPVTTATDRKSLLVETSSSSSCLSLSPSPRKSSVISNYSDVGNVASRPLDFSAESNGSCSSISNGKPTSNKVIEPTLACNSSSECSSMDESSNSHFERFSSHRVKHSMEKRISNGIEGPLSLTTSQSKDFHPSGSTSQDEPDDEKSMNLMGNRFENPRVRIMEGGFESNEDYTYVRGRGRGRYVCESCGIRCKKPSMLRKHLKTHTDFRPYTCKLCNFSFKTKGNLTKHQKSKSHHKKCLGLGIHPNSSRSLAMTGPQFSDTNDTDDSDDDDDNGCDNGDTDSQDEEDVSSSAEPDTIESQSVEKEIAQSLLDLSKISRMPTDSDATMDESSSKVLEFPSPSKTTHTSRLTPERRNGFRHFPIDENSSSLDSTAVEVPIDLSCRSAKANSVERESEAKKPKLERSPYIRSFGVVGEAQRWEPEEEFAITGCLNLKKVPNESNNCRNFNGSVNGFDLTTNHNGGIPLNVDIKPEIRSLNLTTNSSTNNMIPAGENPYDFKQKRRRESSTSSSCGDSSNFPPLQPHQSPLNQPTMQMGLQNNNNNNNSTNSPAPKQPKLHQPWLSPQGPSKSSPEVVVKQDVDSFPKVPPPQVNGDVIERKFLDTAEPSMLPGVPMEQPRLGQITSPTNMFSGVAGTKRQAEFREPSGPQALVKDEGKAECNVCGKIFARASQLNLHMNIHYLERPFRCDPCGVSFRTKGHLIKHRRSSSHDCKVKVYLTESWGVANEENPRPFKCPDCKIAFRIHGHLAKHLRSKMHIMRMECLGKLPFGIYFEMEKCGLNLTEIDTSDCDMSLISLQGVAKKIYGETWTERLTVPMEEPV